MGRRKRLPTLVPTDAHTGEPRSYGLWMADHEGYLLEWLEDPANCALYMGAGKRNNMTGKLTTGTTKAAVYRRISGHLAKLGVQRDSTMIENKMIHLEKSYKNALAYLGTTSSSCHSSGPERLVGDKMDTATRSIVLNHCPYWDRLHPIYADQVFVRPPRASDSQGASDGQTDSVDGEEDTEASDYVNYNDTKRPEVDLNSLVHEGNLPVATNQDSSPYSIKSTRQRKMEENLKSFPGTKRKLRDFECQEDLFDASRSVFENHDHHTLDETTRKNSPPPDRFSAMGTELANRLRMLPEALAQTTIVKLRKIIVQAEYDSYFST